MGKIDEHPESIRVLVLFERKSLRYVFEEFD
jgi:hypothetical protein